MLIFECVAIECLSLMYPYCLIINTQYNYVYDLNCENVCNVQDDELNCENVLMRMFVGMSIPTACFLFSFHFKWSCLDPRGD